MTSPIEAPKQAGSVDLLFALPLVLCVAWGAAILSEAFLVQQRAERAAWTLGISTAYGVSKNVAVSAARLVARPNTEHSEIQILSSSICPSSAAQGLSGMGQLPMAFEAALGLSCAKSAEVPTFKSVSGLIRTLGTLGLAPSKSGETSDDVKEFNFKATMTIPGDDFRGSDNLKYSLWQEAMWKAGFGSTPLQTLALPELRRAAEAGGMGIGSLGGGAGEVAP